MFLYKHLMYKATTVHKAQLGALSLLCHTEVMLETLTELEPVDL